MILLTAPLKGQETPRVVNHAHHDWSVPLILEATNPGPRSRPLVFPLNKLVTGARMLVSGGAQSVWVRDAVRRFGQLERGFHPDVVWCTFGKLEAVVVARRIARRVGCAWVLDVKDNWELYVPRGIRRLMAMRIRGWSAVTVNAEFNFDTARKWLGADADVVYSGVDDAFFEVRRGSCNSSSRFVTVIGSVYSPERLAVLLRGIRKWCLSLDARERKIVLVKYLGADGDTFKRVADACVPDMPAEVVGYLPIEQMAALCRQAIANTYVRHTGTFHHKLLELLACQRPLIVHPSESAESRRLAHEACGDLCEAESEDRVADGLVGAASSVRSADACAINDESRVSAFSWRNQAQRLEKVLDRVAKGGL